MNIIYITYNLKGIFLLFVKTFYHRKLFQYVRCKYFQPDLIIFFLRWSILKLFLNLCILLYWQIKIEFKNQERKKKRAAHSCSIGLDVTYKDNGEVYILSKETIRLEILALLELNHWWIWLPYNVVELAFFFFFFSFFFFSRLQVNSRRCIITM